MGVQIGLQDEDGSHAVDGGGALGDAELGFAQKAVSLHRGEALVPEMNGKLKARAKLIGKGADFFRLTALLAAHAQGETDHNFANIVLANGTLQELEIGTLVLTADGFQALRGDPKRVGNSHANGLGAHIQGQDACAGQVRRLIRR